MTRHLDLGCGDVPRNPYRRDDVCGVDLRGADSDGGGPIRRANLALQPIPFDDDSFDSVSAYDFLEHVPRVLLTADGTSTRFPFVELMNEVWRVLRPGGLFYAVTPAFPSKAAFVDPTHVNIITEDTHTYFTRPQRRAEMYGFSGDFALRRAHWTKTRAEQVYVPAPRGPIARLRLAHRAWRARHGATGHMVWEFEALKPAR